MDKISKKFIKCSEIWFFSLFDEMTKLMAKMWKLNYLIKLTIKRNGFVLLSIEMEVNIHKFITFLK